LILFSFCFFFLKKSKRNKKKTQGPIKSGASASLLFAGAKKNSICGAAICPRISAICRKSSNRFFAQARYQKPRCRDFLEGRLGRKNFLLVDLRFLRVPCACFNLYFKFLQSGFSNGRH
jgi:hypothetical protein